MTPQERQLVDDLFDRLSKVEAAPRDPVALDAIAQGQRRAPNALYALVQTVLLQDEALKRANERIQQLEQGGAAEPAAQGGFLDSMRDALFGGQPQQSNAPRGSVPSAGASRWNSGQVIGQQPQQGGYAPQQGYPQQGGGYAPQQAPQQGGGGGSFLGTAAAAAAGMVGGSLLLNSIRGMMGGSHQQGLADAASGNFNSPWSGGSSGGSLGDQAGLNDIDRSDAYKAGAYDQSHADLAQQDADQDQDQDQDDGDYGAMDADSDDSDYA